MALLVIGLLTLLNLGTGFGLLSLLVPQSLRPNLDPLEQLLLMLSAGVLANSLLGLLLAEAGLFFPWIPLALGLILTAAGCYQAWARKESWHLPDLPALPVPFTQWMLPGRAEYLLVALGLLGASLIYFRPHEIMWGGADAGVYIDLGAYLAQQGTLVIEDELLAGISPDLYPTFLRTMPDGTFFWSSGFLVTDETGRIWPPFYHLHVVWLAAGFVLGGVGGALLLTPYWALLATFAIYLFARRLMQASPHGWWLALCVVGSLVITAIQVWFARYPTSEMLTQFLFWVGLWAFIVWAEADYRGGTFACLAGCAWGATFLVRIDTFFVWLIPGVLAICLYGERRWHRSQLWFFAPLIILPIYATWHALLFARPYFDNIYGYALAVAWQQFWWLLPIVGLVGVLFLLLLRRGRPLAMLAQFWGTGRWLLLLGGVALALYAWLLRPRLGSALEYVNPWDNVTVQQWNHMNLRHLGWYMSAPAVFLAIAGMLRLWWDVQRRTWAMLLLGTIFALFYLWNIRSNGIHMYALRRYVPIVIPFFVLSAILLVDWMLQRSHAIFRIAGWLLLIVWLAGIAWTSRGFLSQTNYQTMPVQFETLVEQFPENAIFLFNQARPVDLGDHLSVPAKLIYGQHAFTVQNMTGPNADRFVQTLGRWQAEGWEIYWVELSEPNPSPLAPEYLTFETTFEFRFTVLESTYDRKPVNVQSILWTADIYRLLPLPQS